MDFRFAAAAALPSTSAAGFVHGVMHLNETCGATAYYLPVELVTLRVDEL